jgi:calcium-dependent protein kinase
MELCRGGELFTKIIDNNKPMTEPEVSSEMSKLLRAL